MGGFCRSCANWTQSTALKSVGYCTSKRDMIHSIHTCGKFSAKPIPFTARMAEILSSIWERTGQPVADSAMSSRKTMEMMIIFTGMFIGFAYMMIKVFPVFKDAMIKAFVR